MINKKQLEKQGYSFKKIGKIEYSGGFGAQEIAADLIIYFKDKSYITRGEYDGSEWWEYKSK